MLLSCPECHLLLSSDELFDGDVVRCENCGRGFICEQPSLSRLLWERCRLEYKLPLEQCCAEINLLLENGARVNRQGMPEEMPPLFQSVKPEIVKLLLEHGADIHASNANGHTAILNSLLILARAFGVNLPCDMKKVRDLSQDAGFAADEASLTKLVTDWYEYLRLMSGHGAGFSHKTQASKLFCDYYIMLHASPLFRKISSRFPLKKYFRHKDLHFRFDEHDGDRQETPAEYLTRMVQPLENDRKEQLQICQEIFNNSGFFTIPDRDGKVPCLLRNCGINLTTEQYNTAPEYKDINMPKDEVLIRLPVSASMRSLCAQEDSTAYPEIYVRKKMVEYPGKFELSFRMKTDDMLIGVADKKITEKYCKEPYAIIGAKIINVTRDYIALLLMVKTTYVQYSQDRPPEYFRMMEEMAREWKLKEGREAPHPGCVGEIIITPQGEGREPKVRLIDHVAAAAIGHTMMPDSNPAAKYIAGRVVMGSSSPISTYILGKAVLDNSQDDDPLFPAKKKKRRGGPKYKDIDAYSSDEEACDDGFDDGY